MTTATTHPTPSRPMVRAFRAELTKLRTVRSTWTTVIATATVSVALAAVVAASQTSRWDEMSPTQRADFDPISTSLVGLLFSTVFLGALGVRATAGEHSTGMVDVTRAAIPRRVRVLLAKAAVVGVVAVPLAIVVDLASFGAGQATLADRHLGVGLGDPGALRAVLLGSVAVGLVGVLGVALGTLVRRTALATTVLAVAVVGSQLFAVALPEGARRFLPGSALQASVGDGSASDLLSPVAGISTLALYSALALAAALAVSSIEDRPARG